MMHGEIRAAPWRENKGEEGEQGEEGDQGEEKRGDVDCNKGSGDQGRGGA